MARSNVANHSLRLNLDNEQHRRVEKVLAGLNLDVHKSINQFLVEAADAYISRLEGSELTYEDVPKKEEVRNITREDLEELRREIKDELQKEMISILGSALITGKVIQMPEVRTVRENITQKENEEDMSVNETTMGLVSSWG